MMIQARLYWRIIRQVMDMDDYFKDFTLDDYRFIVVNKSTLTPLVWRFPLTATSGTLTDGKGGTYRDPFDIGDELSSYLHDRPQVPKGIDMNGVNVIRCLRPLADKDTVYTSGFLQAGAPVSPPCTYDFTASDSD